MAIHFDFIVEDEDAEGIWDCISQYALDLELSKDGHPKHPLYLRKTLKPIKYR